MWFEDVEIGAVTPLGSHHFSADEIIRFASAFDPQPFHLSEAAGKASVFGGLAASGWHTAAIWQQLMTRHAIAERERQAGAAPPMVLLSETQDLRWLKPVLAGDTITYRLTVLAKASAAGAPGWGRITTRGEGVNQADALVFHLTVDRFAKMRYTNGLFG